MAQVSLTWKPPLSESSKASEIESKETFRTSLNQRGAKVSLDLLKGWLRFCCYGFIIARVAEGNSVRNSRGREFGEEFEGNSREFDGGFGEFDGFGTCVEL